MNDDAQLERLLDSARSHGLSAAPDAWEVAAARLARLPLVHRLKATHLTHAACLSIINDGLRSPTARAMQTSPWRRGARTNDDVFFSAGVLLYDQPAGPVSILRRDASALAHARGTPWDHGAPKHVLGEVQGLAVFEATDLARRQADRYAAFLGASCWDDVHAHPRQRPTRRDPPGVLGTLAEPSWVPELRVPVVHPLRNHLLAVVAPPDVWPDPRGRGLFRQFAEEEGATWVESSSGLHAAVDEVILALVAADDAANGWNDA